MTRALSAAVTLLGAGLLAAAYLSAKLAWPAAALLLWLVFWMLAFVRRWDWIHTPGLYLLFAFVAAGSFLDLEPALLYPGALLALGGWDLADFAARLRLAAPGDDTAPLQSRHLQRLGLTLGAGAGLLLLALVLDLRLPLGWMAVLAIAAVWGLGRLVRGLLKKE